MNWGHKIFISFLLFGGFIITLVVVCVRQDFYLVSPNYYQEELNYESKMNKSRNVSTLSAPPEIVLLSNELNLTFPKDAMTTMKGGEVVLFRPSNANHDFSEKLTLDVNGVKKVDLTGRPKGLWKVEVTWGDGQKEYYMEKKIFL